MVSNLKFLLSFPKIDDYHLFGRFQQLMLFVILSRRLCWKYCRLMLLVFGKYSTCSKERARKSKWVTDHQLVVEEIHQFEVKVSGFCEVSLYSILYTSFAQKRFYLPKNQKKILIKHVLELQCSYRNQHFQTCRVQIRRVALSQTHRFLTNYYLIITNFMTNFCLVHQHRLMTTHDYASQKDHFLLTSVLFNELPFSLNYFELHVVLRVLDVKSIICLQLWEGIQNLF